MRRDFWWRTLPFFALFAYCATDAGIALFVKAAYSSDWWFGMVEAMLTVLAGSVMAASVNPRRHSYAMFFPGTRSEYEKSAIEGRRHWRQIGVASGTALLAASVAVCIALFVKK